MAGAKPDRQPAVSVATGPAAEQLVQQRAVKTKLTATDHSVNNEVNDRQPDNATVHDGNSKSGRPRKVDMADPFEVRVRFSSQLQNLNASVTSAQKAAAYAMKYKDMDEDLHSCILEQLEKVTKAPTPNARRSRPA